MTPGTRWYASSTDQKQPAATTSRSVAVTPHTSAPTMRIERKDMAARGGVGRCGAVRVGAHRF